MYHRNAKSITGSDLSIGMDCILYHLSDGDTRFSLLRVKKRTEENVVSFAKPAYCSVDIYIAWMV